MLLNGGGGAPARRPISVRRHVEKSHCAIGNPTRSLLYMILCTTHTRKVHLPKYKIGKFDSGMTTPTETLLQLEASSTTEIYTTRSLYVATPHWWRIDELIQAAKAAPENVRKRGVAGPAGIRSGSLDGAERSDSREQPCLGTVKRRGSKIHRMFRFDLVQNEKEARCICNWFLKN
jgi:hypothetical protein